MTPHCNPIEIINSNEILSTHIDALIAIEPIFNDAFQQTGLPDLRLQERGFKNLLKTIVSQQLPVAAARSIWHRVNDAGLVTEIAIQEASDEHLRTMGLSKQKIRYVKSLAKHHIDYHALVTTDDESVITTLTEVTGIGRWTAEIYCLFSLNRPDIFAANDLALQVSAETLFGLTKRPTEKVMREIAKKWAPHRSAAAYLLWSYYSIIKKRDGIC